MFFCRKLPLSLLLSCLFLPAVQAVERQDFVIAIDTGHSPTQPGATSARGKPEYLFNKAITRQLHQKLQSLGFTGSFLVNEAEAEVSLASRPAEASQKKASLFISIHHDSVNPRYLGNWEYATQKNHYSDHFRGYSMFIFEAQRPESLYFAEQLGENLLSRGLTPSLHHAEKIQEKNGKVAENYPLLDRLKGIYTSQHRVLKLSTQPAALLLECGVIVHREEELLLETPEYQAKLVNAVADSIGQYFNQLQANNTLIQQ